MFFLSESLHPQLKRRLTMAWLAATVGLNKMPKEDVIQLDVVKLCGDVTCFLLSNSSDPKKRFSLRLSTMLTHGTILLWNRQIKFCLDESLHFITNLQEQRKTNIELNVNGASKIPQPKTVPKRVRAKKIVAENLLANYEIHVPQEVVDQLFSNQESFIKQRVRDITLQEIEPFHRQNDPEDDYFGEQPLPVTLKPGDQVQEIPLSVIQLKETAIEEPEQMPFVAAPGIPMLQIMSVTEDRQANKENEAPALPPMQITTNMEKSASEPDRFALPRAPKKVQNIAKALYVKMGNPKIVSINCPIETVEDDVNYKEFIKNWDAPLPTFAYFENFGGTEEQRIVDTLQVPQLLSTSGPSDIRNIRSASGSKSELKEASRRDTLSEETKSVLPVETISSSLTPMIETSLIEHFPPAAANGRRSPVKKLQHMPALPRSILSKQQKEIDQSINASIGHDVELHEQVQIRSHETSEFGVKWADRIMALLENHPRLTHVELCNHLNERLNKRNMATIFATLLGKI